MPHHQQTTQHREVARTTKRLDSSLRFAMVKRLMDASISGCLLILFAPLLIGCAVWIRMIGGPGVCYSQWRVGRDGYLFRIRKLRTMRRDAERGGAQWAATKDPRVLPGCHWMRRSHVDELPQLWNILIGEMSLVGPRPERPEMLEELRESMPGIETRLIATPGLTGLAQVRHGYTNDVAGARSKLAWDLRYLRSRSILGDVRLMIETVPKFWDSTAC